MYLYSCQVLRVYLYSCQVWHDEILFRFYASHFLKKGGGCKGDICSLIVHATLSYSLTWYSYSYDTLTCYSLTWSGMCWKIVHVMLCIIILVEGVFVVAIKVSCVWIYLCNSVRVVAYCLSWFGTPHDNMFYVYKSDQRIFRRVLNVHKGQAIWRLSAFEVSFQTRDPQTPGFLTFQSFCNKTMKSLEVREFLEFV